MAPHRTDIILKSLSTTVQECGALEKHNLKLDATVTDFPCSISRDGSRFFAIASLSAVREGQHVYGGPPGEAEDRSCKSDDATKSPPMTNISNLSTTREPT